MRNPKPGFSVACESASGRSSALHRGQYVVAPVAEAVLGLPAEYAVYLLGKVGAIEPFDADG
jgi:hypothetical protein